MRSLYDPIQGEMLRVEEVLKTVGAVNSHPIGQVLGHILKVRGKRLRPALTLLTGRFHDYNPELLVSMAVAVELLHTATLVHDDTLDNSAVRRGVPTANCLWSGGVAVLAGDYLFARSAEFVASTGDLRVIRLFAAVLATICNGELEQNLNAYNPEPDRQRYFRMIGNKTASLFSVASESGALLSQAPARAVEALRDYGYNLGMAFQIVDDILDFFGDAGEMGKPVGSDLIQGTLTLPAILLMEQYGVDNPARAYLRSRHEADLKRAIEMIRNSSIIQESRDIAAGFCLKARTSLECLPPIPSRRCLLDLLDYVMDRTS